MIILVNSFFSFDTKLNASNLFLTRVRRYVINFITDPLEELNRIVDDSNPDITDNYQGIVDNLKDTADKLLPRAQSAQTSTDNQCKEKEPECKPEDFQVMENKVPSDNTIKCRINYQDYVSYKAKVKRLDANILANNHDKVNSLKVELKDFNSDLYSENNIFGRTFGFGNVYINGVKENEFLKAISNPGNIPRSFLPPIGASYPKFFDINDFNRVIDNRVYNKNDTEIVILEYVINKYVLAK